MTTGGFSMESPPVKLLPPAIPPFRLAVYGVNGSRRGSIRTIQSPLLSSLT